MPNSHRVICTIAAVLLAIAATMIGWSQSLIYKDVPQIPLAIWFPFIVLTSASDFAMVLLSLVQFPLFAVAFTLAICRWPVARVTLVLAILYTLLVVLALFMVKTRELN